MSNTLIGFRRSNRSGRCAPLCLGGHRVGWQFWIGRWSINGKG